MKLLVITQKVDRQDDVFGFFHRWLEKFAQRVEFLHVVCLWQGQHSLPGNVRVWSLGKESGRSRLRYVWRFYKYIWQFRDDYDGVFVHMNPIYVVLGGIFWKVWRKRTCLWYNHQAGDLMNRAAFWLVHCVFYTSPFSFASKFKKGKKMPAGIDTDIFKREQEIVRQKNSILSIGRISAIKKIDVLIESAKLLDKEDRDFVLRVVGQPDEEDREYFQELKNLAKDLESKGKIKFLGKVPNYQTPRLYNQNDVFVNLSPAGLFDKAILEAMSCQTLVLVSSKAFENVLPSCLMFRKGDTVDLKNKMLALFEMPEEKKAFLRHRLRNYVIENHNLNILVDKIIQQYENV